ncbi:MAG: PPOX class F420-dependent oxidoreductase [Acidimicrobiales bacterium]|nr:PPOX class F420-dependent oxidoreductase [Acidimicrobiales bacterium]
MTDEDIEAFIRATPARTVAASTTRKDGRPHVVPVWVEFDGDRIVFNTSAESVKGRSLRRDPRIALAFHDDVPPFNFVLVEGTTELIDDRDIVATWAGRIGGRYMGPERAEEYAERNGSAGQLLVSVTRSKVIAAKDVAD